MNYKQITTKLIRCLKMLQHIRSVKSGENQIIRRRYCGESTDEIFSNEKAYTALCPAFYIRF
jgi:hypothetical protein